MTPLTIDERQGLLLDIFRLVAQEAIYEAFKKEHDRQSGAFIGDRSDHQHGELIRNKRFEEHVGARLKELEPLSHMTWQERLMSWALPEVAQEEINRRHRREEADNRVVMERAFEALAVEIISKESNQSSGGVLDQDKVFELQNTFRELYAAVKDVSAAIQRHEAAYSERRTGQAINLYPASQGVRTALAHFSTVLDQDPRTRVRLGMNPPRQVFIP